MANDLNQCNFIGRCGADPETRYSQGGTAITNIRIACGWKGKDKEGTEWIPVVFFGKLAEIAGEYLRKGSQVYVSGRFTTEQWEKDGQKRYTSKVIADRMQMLGGKDSGNERTQSGRSQGGQEPVDTDFDSDSIPF